MRATWCLAAVLCAYAAGVDGGEDVSVGQGFGCIIQSTGIAWMSETKAILVCQVSENTRIYVTEDRGRTWVEEVAAQCANDGQACYTNINFEDRHHAILGTAGGALEWDIGSAADLGATVRAKIDGGGDVGTMAYVRSHPTEPGTELGLQFVDPTCERRCPSKVFLSEDYGKTWERILEDKIVEDANWGDRAAKSFHPHEIFFIYTTHNAYSGTKDFTDLFSFNYKEETEREVLRDCFYWVNRLGFTYYVVAGQHDKNTLHVSADNGEHVTAAVFPSDQPEEKYYVLRGSDGVAFVAVHHVDCLKGNTHGWGRLYQSGTTGSRFKLALDNIRWLPGTEPDFHNVEALDGVYMANVALVDEPKCKYCASAYCTSQCRYVTVISYENADPETWHKLAAPHGTVCDGDCFLHLHDAASVQSWIPQLLSKSSAPGVIVGAGNTGGSLDADDVNMYLTLDAGVSWRKILDGAHTLDWTDYGGLMVAAPTQSATQEYHYSFDMGQTWQSETFTTLTDVRVHRVIASGGAAYANSTQAHFMLYCSHIATGKTIVFSTDLTPEQHLHPVCNMPKYGETIGPDSDFQLFAPRGSGEECFMGQKVTFLQKKSGHQCWNPSTAGMDVYWTSKKCACTLEDYECEVGFKQNGASKRMPKRSESKKYTHTHTHTTVCVSRETRSVVWDTVKKKWTSPPEEDPHMPRFCVGKTYLRTKGYAMKPGFHCVCCSFKKPPSFAISPPSFPLVILPPPPPYPSLSHH